MQVPDTPQTFHNSGAATGNQINKVFMHYGSPLVGQGEIIARIAQDEGINPILLLAVMQQETQFGRGDDGSARPEWVTNPCAIHFAPDAKGMDKLHLQSGQLCTVEQSVRAAAKQMKQMARGSQTPRSTMARVWSQTSNWGAEVEAKFSRLSQSIRSFRG